MNTNWIAILFFSFYTFQLYSSHEIIFKKCQEMDFESLKSFVLLGGDPNITDEHGNTLIMHVIMGKIKGNEDSLCSADFLIKFLIEHGVDVNGFNREGKTAMHLAIEGPKPIDNEFDLHDIYSFNRIIQILIGYDSEIIFKNEDICDLKTYATSIIIGFSQNNIFVPYNHPSKIVLNLIDEKLKDLKINSIVDSSIIGSTTSSRSVEIVNSALDKIVIDLLMMSNEEAIQFLRSKDDEFIKNVIFRMLTHHKILIKSKEQKIKLDTLNIIKLFKLSTSSTPDEFLSTIIEKLIRFLGGPNTKITNSHFKLHVILEDIFFSYDFVQTLKIFYKIEQYYKATYYNVTPEILNSSTSCSNDSYHNETGVF